MGKFALLIGVGNYESSELQNLAAALPDVWAMEKVLIDPAIAGFEPIDVAVLPNPKPQEMREAIERLFTSRQKDDLVFLYFSGHGVVDDYGKFYLTCAQTDKGILNSTAIPATFLHGLMEGCRSQRQVMILDSCFSGAFAKEMKAKGQSVNLQPQLGGKGWAVLTSSSATEYSFEQKEGELSVYTEYVVEGLRTGIADRDEDGWISIDELHEFAQGKVREVAPAMQPKIYAVEEGYKIVFAKAPIGDPQLAYRKEVERLAQERDGELSEIVLMGLETKQKQLGLSDITAESIRQEVLHPYQELAEKVQTFQQALQKVCGTGLQITDQSWNDLSYLQQALGLKDENIKPFIQNIQILSKCIEEINEPIVSEFSSSTQPVEQDPNVKRYENKRPEVKQIFSNLIEASISSVSTTIGDAKFENEAKILYGRRADTLRYDGFDVRSDGTIDFKISGIDQLIFKDNIDITWNYFFASELTNLATSEEISQTKLYDEYNDLTTYASYGMRLWNKLESYCDEKSCAEQDFFKLYCSLCFQDTHQGAFLPALIPNVYISWESSKDEILTSDKPNTVGFVFKSSKFGTSNLTVIEIDKPYHYSNYGALDEEYAVPEKKHIDHLKKDRWLQNKGFKVFRIDGNEIKKIISLEKENQIEAFYHFFRGVFGNIIFLERYHDF